MAARDVFGTDDAVANVSKEAHVENMATTTKRKSERNDNSKAPVKRGRPCKPSPRPRPVVVFPEDDGREQVVVTQEKLADGTLLMQCWEILQRKRIMYQHNGLLTAVLEQYDSPLQMTPTVLTTMLLERICFVEGRPNDLFPVRSIVPPPHSLCRGLQTLRISDTVTPPPLRFISDGPCFVSTSPRMTINKNGYNEQAGIVVRDCKEDEPCMSLDFDEATVMLMSLLENFPFATKIDHAAAVAALLTPVSQATCFPDRPPVILISGDESTQGTMVLAQLIAAIATSTLPVVRTKLPLGCFQTDTSKDLNPTKELGRIMKTGKRVYIVDNFPTDLSRPEWIEALRTPVYQMHEIYTDRTFTVPLDNTLFIALGSKPFQVPSKLRQHVLHISMNDSDRFPRTRPSHSDATLVLDPVKFVKERRHRVLNSACRVLMEYHAETPPSDVFFSVDVVRCMSNWSKTIRTVAGWLTKTDPFCIRDRQAVTPAFVPLSVKLRVTAQWARWAKTEYRTLRAAFQDESAPEVLKTTLGQYAGFSDEEGKTFNSLVQRFPGDFLGVTTFVHEIGMVKFERLQLNNEYYYRLVLVQEK